MSKKNNDASVIGQITLHVIAFFSLITLVAGFFLAWAVRYRSAFLESKTECGVEHDSALVSRQLSYLEA